MSKLRAADSDSNQRVFDFLIAHPIGVLATVDSNGAPHGAVIYYTVDEEFNVRFTTKRDTKKHDNLTHNNKAMLVAYDADTQTTVQIIGNVEDISDSPEAEEVFTSIVHIAQETSKSGVPPISQIAAGYYVTWCIAPAQIRLAAFGQAHAGAPHMYETINFAN